jgi:hypothetical protein
MVLHTLLCFGSFTAVIILFLVVVAATWWLLSRNLMAAEKRIAAVGPIYPRNHGRIMRRLARDVQKIR